MNDIATAAREALQWIGWRDDETSRVYHKEGCPPWVLDLLYRAHDYLYTDQGTLRTIYTILSSLSTRGYDAEAENLLGWEYDNPYLRDLTRWLNDQPDRARFVDQALAAGATTLYDAIAQGQHLERLSMFHRIVTFLRDERIQEDSKEISR